MLLATPPLSGTVTPLMSGTTTPPASETETPLVPGTATVPMTPKTKWRKWWRAGKISQAIRENTNDMSLPLTVDTVKLSLQKLGLLKRVKDSKSTKKRQGRNITMPTFQMMCIKTKTL